jgi:hypothetical protein
MVAPAPPPPPLDPDPRLKILRDMENLRTAKAALDAVYGPLPTEMLPASYVRLTALDAAVRALERTPGRELSAGEVSTRIGEMGLQVRGENSPKAIYAALNTGHQKKGLKRRVRAPKDVVWSSPLATDAPMRQSRN